MVKIWKNLQPEAGDPRTDSSERLLGTSSLSGPGLSAENAVEGRAAGKLSLRKLIV